MWLSQQSVILYNTLNNSGAFYAMQCKYCAESEESRLMTRTSLVNGKVETIDVCLECWWSKEVHGKTEDGNLLSKQEPGKGIGSPKASVLYKFPGQGKNI